MGEAERIASLGLEEFRRHLPYALRGRRYRWVTDHAVEVEAAGEVEMAGEVEAAGGTVTITVEELAPLSLSAVFTLPRLRVSFAFNGGDDAEHAVFLAAYDRAFQRGGG